MRWLQIALGGVWVLDGALQLQPFMFKPAFVTRIIAPNAVGQPGLVAWTVRMAAHLIEPRVLLFSVCAGAIQLLIGLGLFWRPTVRIALAVSFGWVLGVWWIGEGFGGILTGTASPLTGAPGAALLYLIVGLVIWPTSAKDGRGARRGGALGEGGARIAWGTLWCGSAVLWLLPGNRSPQAVRQAISTAPSGLAWLSNLHRAVSSAAGGRGLAIAMVAASLSALIGLSVLFDHFTLPALAMSAVMAVVYSFVGQGFGGVFTGSGTDPNTAPLLVLFAVSLYLLLPAAATSRSVPSLARSEGAGAKTLGTAVGGGSAGR
jgi:hypothetical protein